MSESAALGKSGSLADEVAKLLANRDERVVFAESCTAGMVSATLAQIPGVSKSLCGSAVTYQPKIKRRWIGVKKGTIKQHTTESQHVANEMALGVLKRTPCANWGVSIVGHFGPDAPTEKDGQIFICCARRTLKGNLKVKETQVYVCKSETRTKRQMEATEVVLTCLARELHKLSQKDGKGSSEAAAATNGIVKPKKKDKGDKKVRIAN
jgi:PncC family amidohydrolase